MSDEQTKTPVRLQQRFQNLEKALELFQKRRTDLLQNPKGSTYNEACQMAMIQAFEIVIELSWKTMKDYLELAGYDEVQNGKKAVRQALIDNLIDNGEVWLSALETRNITSHTYDISIIEGINIFVIEKFYPELLKLYKTLKAKI